MSYVKKDEDADQMMMKLDRTTVFQDGVLLPNGKLATLADFLNSTVIQFVSHIAAEMSNSFNQDRCALVHRRAIPDERSHHFIFWNLEVVSKQGSFATANGLPDLERVGQYRRRCDYVHVYHYERHLGWK
jgi:hypothetical protein